MFLPTLLLASSVAAAAQGETEYRYRVEDSTLWITAPDGNAHQVSIPCHGANVTTDAHRLYVACENDGVAIFSLESRSTPQIEGVHDLGGTVVGFHKVNEQVWAELVRTEARLLTPMTLGPRPAPAPIAHAPGGAPPPAATPATKRGEIVAPPSAEIARPRPAGSVVGSGDGNVVLDLGLAQGLGRGDRVAFVTEHEVSLGEGAPHAIEEEILAVGTVTAVSETRAQVRLGFGEHVPIGTRAVPTTKPVSANLLVPPRVSDAWEVAYTLRPFLALGARGVGTMSDGSIGVRLEPSLHLVALFEPLGLGFANKGNIVAMAGNIIAAYDTRFFEIGLGAGWSAVNNDIETSTQSTILANDERAVGVGFDRVRSGLSLAQLARLGSLDGLQLSVRNTFLYYRNEFRYGGTVASVSVPLVYGWWLIGRGGGGNAGFGFGELGTRVLLWGNGGRHSLFVNASVGGAGLSAEKKVSCAASVAQSGDLSGQPRKCFASFGYAGPMLGLGLEWRP